MAQGWPPARYCINGSAGWARTSPQGCPGSHRSQLPRLPSPQGLSGDTGHPLPQVGTRSASGPRQQMVSGPLVSAVSTLGSRFWNVLREGRPPWQQEELTREHGQARQSGPPRPAQAPGRASRGAQEPQATRALSQRLLQSWAHLPASREPALGARGGHGEARGLQGQGGSREGDGRPGPGVGGQLTEVPQHSFQGLPHGLLQHQRALGGFGQPGRTCGGRGREGSGSELLLPPRWHLLPPETVTHRRTLTLGLDGRAVDGHVGVPGGVPRAQDLSAQAPGDPRELGGVQVESLSRLHGKLGAPAAPGWDAVGALRKGAGRPNTAP